MQRPLVLRIDFTHDGSPLCLPPVARGVLRLRNLRPSATLNEDILTAEPDVICFDFDYPEPDSLARLQQVKADFPSLPVLMLTLHNSEELTVWALRARVWDYFAKPLDTDAFLQAVQQLHELRNTGEQGRARKIVVPASSQQRETERRKAASAAANAAERAVAKAKAFVAHNYAEKISACEVAKLCNMSSFHFSRSFKRICGVTFSEHLLEVRIRKAIELLSHPRATVTGAGYEVGFRDPSYFSRIFKRYAGITPSEYRDRYVRKDRRKADAAQQTSSAYGRADTVEDDALVEAEVKPAGKLRR